MRNISLAGVLLLGFLGITNHAFSHDIALDMDPSTPGIIETNLTVMPGEMFDVDVVIVSDGSAFFSSVGVAVEYNDSGPTLTHNGSVFDADGNGLSGSGNVAMEVNGWPVPDTLLPGEPVTSYGFGPVSFNNSDGGAVFMSFPPGTFFYDGGGLPGAGGVIRVERLSFTANAEGTTEIAAFGLLDGDPLAPPVNVPGPPLFAFDLLNTSFQADNFRSGFVNVTTVPEPGTVGLMAISLGLLSFWRRRKTWS